MTLLIRSRWAGLRAGRLSVRTVEPVELPCLKLWILSCPLPAPLTSPYVFHCKTFIKLAVRNILPVNKHHVTNEINANTTPHTDSKRKPSMKKATPFIPLEKIWTNCLYTFVQIVILNEKLHLLKCDKSRYSTLCSSKQSKPRKEIIIQPKNPIVTTHLTFCSDNKYVERNCWLTQTLHSNPTISVKTCCCERSQMLIFFLITGLLKNKTDSNNSIAKDTYKAGINIFF